MNDPVQLGERFNVPLHVMKKRLGMRDWGGSRCSYTSAALVRGRAKIAG